MVKFVIFGHPRCGSTFLCSLLESHPKILCHYEVFHPSDISTVYGFRDKISGIGVYTPQTRDEHPVEFINTLFKHNLHADAVGFKIFIGHSKEAHEYILNDKSIKKIILRRNSIQAYVSMLIADTTGEFTQKSAANSRGQKKVSLDAGGLLNFDRIIREYFTGITRTLQETGQEYLELHYEDLAADIDTVNSLFSYIGIDRGEKDLSAFTHKQNKSSLADKIDNFEGVIAELMGFYFEKESIVKRYKNDIERLEALVRVR
jgi:LPS sulfotransferase NodH